MLELALSLTLLGGAPAPPAPHLRLVQPLALAQAGAVPASAPDLSVRPPGAARRPSQAKQALLSSGGVLLGDAVAAGIFVLGIASLMGDLFEGGTSSETEELLLLGVVTWLFLPPALGVGGATAGGASPERWSGAYWVAFLLRLGGGVAVGALANKDRDTLAIPLLLATELVVVPLAIVRVLGGGAPPGPAPGPALASPAQLAVPMR